MEVPRPISSSMTRLRARWPWWRMFAVSLISTMKVDWPRARSSLAPTRVKMRSHDAERAPRCAGTKLPTCAISAISATCRR